MPETSEESKTELAEHNHLIPKKSPQYTVSKILLNRGIPLDLSELKNGESSFILKPSNEAFLTYIQVISTPEFKAIRNSLSDYPEPNFDNCDFAEDIKKKLKALFLENKAKEVEERVRMHRPRPELGSEYYVDIKAEKAYAKDFRRRAKVTRGKLKSIKEKEIRLLLERIVDGVLAE